jgi:hypothetical protein
LWWLLAAVLVAAAIGGVLLVRSRRRAAEWEARFSSTRDEVTWFARDLTAALASSQSPEQLTGGWRVAEPRVIAAEDALTGLASSAPGEERADRAGRLRDAVRAARGRVEMLGEVPGIFDAARTATEMRAVSAELDGALLSTAEGAPPPADSSGG